MKKKVFSLFTTLVMLFAIVGVMPKMEVGAATSNDWSWPTSYHSIQSDWPNYSSGKYHAGTDFPVALNSPVYSTCYGEVVAVRSLTTSYGKHIKIKATVNGSTVYMRYCHLNSFNVSVGDTVQSGQLIAYSGSTGNSTGPHLHYEVRDANDRYGSSSSPNLNPRNYLPGSSYSFDDPDVIIYDVNEKYRVSTSSGANLRVRSTYSTSGSIVREVANGTEFVISKRTSTNWGYCGSLGGWLCLDYCVQIPIVNKPSYSSISITNGHWFFNTNETINFHANSDTATNYWLGIDRDGQRVVTESMPNGDFSIAFSESGNYSAYVTSANDAGYLDSERVQFKVLSPVDLGDERKVFIENIETGLLLSVDGNSDNVYGAEKNDPKKQLWKLKRQSDGSYKINLVNNKCLDVYKAGTENGTNIIVYPENIENVNQRFYFYRLNDSYYIKPVFSDLFVDMDVNSSTHNVATWGYGENHPPQKFELIDVENCPHSYGSWETTKSATCTSEGLETRTCTICGEKEIRTIAATGHEFCDWVINKYATCTSEGEEVRMCWNYNCIECETRAIPAKGHKYTTRVVFPTFTEQGYDLHTCSECGDSYKDNYQPMRITGKVSEVVLLQKYLTKKCNLNDEQFTAADLNNDGTVNVFDVVILKRRILNNV